MSPLFAQEAPFEHGAVLQVVIAAVTPTALYRAWPCGLELGVVQLKMCQLHVGPGHARDLDPVTDPRHDAFVGVGFGEVAG